MEECIFLLFFYFFSKKSASEYEKNVSCMCLGIGESFGFTDGNVREEEVLGVSWFDEQALGKL